MPNRVLFFFIRVTICLYLFVCLVKRLMNLMMRTEQKGKFSLWLIKLNEKDGKIFWFLQTIGKKEIWLRTEKFFLKKKIDFPNAWKFHFEKISINPEHFWGWDRLSSDLKEFYELDYSKIFPNWTTFFLFFDLF